ncbi:hypothetical protein PPYR_03066 [Photinus pyralis]|uniref:Tudor domain-containing protein 7 n=1 Tax=Photinus pyralis TaxID=7054 RepID=A0A1Y1M8W0_PHOPY|nr:tudor domain-containing protein 7A isoform X2 [Photinus pyralis]KAB0791266.1 hypothetical protein PPYR_03066 [Photinus pyralis]
MDNDKLRDEVISQIRACLISTKGARDLRQIKSDYSMLMGCEIPYQKLGYKTLELFIRSIPTLRITQQNGQLLVDAVVTQQSAHIAKFVEKQKTKKRTTSRPPPRYQPRQNPRRQAVPPRWRPRTVSTNWQRSYESPRPPATYAHTQVVSSPNPPAKKPSVWERLGNRDGPEVNRSNYAEPGRPSAYSEPSCSYNAPEPRRPSTYSEPNRLPEPTRSSTQPEPKPSVRNRLGPREANTEPSYSFNLIRHALHDLDGNSEKEVTLSRQAKLRLSQKDITEEKVPENPSPLLTPSFSPEFLQWPAAEVPQVASEMNSTPRRTPLDADSSKKNDVITKIPRTGDYWEDLNSFVTMKNLGKITCKVITKQLHRHRLDFFCTITINNDPKKSYRSYPADCLDEKTAKQEASKKALDELEKSCKTEHYGLLLSDIMDVLTRVPAMVKEHPCGVWNTLIQENYIARYNEQLPLNWIEILSSQPNIAMQQIADKYVLNYCEPSQKTNFSGRQAQNVTVLPNTVSFNEDGFLVAEITCVNSAAEIWFSQRETAESDRFASMSLEMEAHYSKLGKYEIAETIQMGGHYVAFSETWWCRVRVFEVNGDDIHCFCIDFGDEWVIKKDALYILKQEFAEVQAQAFVGRLAGLEELYEVSKSSEHLQTLLSRTVQVQQDSNSDDSEADPSDPTLSVVLYDIDTGKPINEEIITYIGIEVATPALIVNAPTDVYVTHALNDGTVYIQSRSVGYEQLMSLIEKAGQNIVDKKTAVTPVKVSKSNGDDLYFIRSKADDLWYRVKIIDWAPGGKHVQVLHVDDGRATVVEVNDTDFYVLRDISDVISKFPLQGLRVRLQLSSVPVNFVDRVRDLMPPNEAVIVKLIKVDTDYVHVVEFFKRSKTDNVLFSINLSLVPENGFRNAAGDGNNNAKSNKLRRLISLNQFDDANQRLPSAGCLTPPEIPEIGQFFDVRVCYTVHPHSFFVQPYNDVQKLNALMVEMQEAFKNVRTSTLQIGDILPGKVYASMYTDGKWYRTSVIKVIHPSSISVFYSDFGYYGNIILTQLHPLEEKFLKLPYQAIKAKLDVQPKNAKWCHDDCDYFKNLIDQKSFVSILRSVEKDILCPGDIVLTLKLIDTSSQNVDVYIDEVIIKEGKAIDNC